LIDKRDVKRPSGELPDRQHVYVQNAMNGFQRGRKAVHSRLRDVAADEIRRLIVSGEALPGTRLRLELLAEHIGVSMTPVREALVALAQEGWAYNEPQKGFRVSSFRRQDIADLYVLNAFVFGELARRAAERMTSVELEEVERLDRELRATPADDARRLEELNNRFHETINAAADAPRLAVFANASRFLPSGLGWSAVPGWVRHVRRGHRPLLRALRARDGEAAAAEMRTQTYAAGDLLMEHLDRGGLFDDSQQSRGRVGVGAAGAPVSVAGAPAGHRRTQT
jgi:DNA-binding GntR family transcriptional regulator